jgi:hypothetical protein
LVVIPAAVFLVTLGLQPTATQARSSSERTALQRYLAAVSWPVRAATLRARRVSGAIANAVSPGDPPFLGQVGAYCRGFRAVEGEARTLGAVGILRAVPPSELRRTHHALADAYTEARAGCVRARAVALALKRALEDLGTKPTANEIERTRRAPLKRLVRFDRTTLHAFKHAVRAWRLAVLRHASAVGIVPPAWTRALLPGT